MGFASRYSSDYNLASNPSRSNSTLGFQRGNGDHLGSSVGFYGDRNTTTTRGSFSRSSLVSATPKGQMTGMDRNYATQKQFQPSRNDYTREIPKAYSSVLHHPQGGHQLRMGYTSLDHGSGGGGGIASLLSSSGIAMGTGINRMSSKAIDCGMSREAQKDHLASKNAEARNGIYGGILPGMTMARSTATREPNNLSYAYPSSTTNLDSMQGHASSPYHIGSTKSSPSIPYRNIETQENTSKLLSRNERSVYSSFGSDTSKVSNSEYSDYSQDPWRNSLRNSNQGMFAPSPWNLQKEPDNSKQMQEKMEEYRRYLKFQIDQKANKKKEEQRTSHQHPFGPNYDSPITRRVSESLERENNSFKITETRPSNLSNSYQSSMINLDPSIQGRSLPQYQIESTTSIQQPSNLYRNSNFETQEGNSSQLLTRSENVLNTAQSDIARASDYAQEFWRSSIRNNPEPSFWKPSRDLDNSTQKPDKMDEYRTYLKFQIEQKENTKKEQKRRYHQHPLGPNYDSPILPTSKIFDREAIESLHKAELKKQIEDNKKLRAERLAKEKEEEARLDRKIQEYQDEQARRDENQKQLEFMKHIQPTLRNMSQENLTPPKKIPSEEQRDPEKTLAVKLRKNKDIGDGDVQFRQSLRSSQISDKSTSRHNTHERRRDPFPLNRQRSPPVPAVLRQLASGMIETKESTRKINQEGGLDFLIKLKTYMQRERDEAEKGLEGKLKDSKAR